MRSNKPHWATPRWMGLPAGFAVFQIAGLTYAVLLYGVISGAPVLLWLVFGVPILGLLGLDLLARRQGRLAVIGAAGAGRVNTGRGCWVIPRGWR